MANEDRATTAELASSYLGALEREKAGYQARVDSAKAGRQERLTEEQLSDRIKQVDAEIKRVKPIAKKADDEA